MKDNRAYISFYNAMVQEGYNDLANLLHRDLPLGLPEGLKRSTDCCTPYGEKRVAVLNHFMVVLG